MSKRLKYFVEDCENWAMWSIVHGVHCWNCANRNGYPSRGQPDIHCENFKPKPTNQPLKADGRLQDKPPAA